jgi:hypothetical protein
MNSSYNEFLRVMFTPVPQEPIVRENKWIQVSEPKWKEGTGFWKGQMVPVYEDGKFYQINGGIFKFIEHLDGSGYLARSTVLDDDKNRATSRDKIYDNICIWRCR